MKSHIQKSLMQGIRDLHIKILQSNNLTDIGNYLQEILDKVNEVPPEYVEKLRIRYWKGVSTAQIINTFKKDIVSILDGTYTRTEIAKYKATLNIAWLKDLFSVPFASR
jgi:hypothetical protein